MPISFNKEGEEFLFVYIYANDYFIYYGIDTMTIEEF